MMNKNKKGTFEGVISTTSRGVGYIPHADFEEDLQVGKENIHTALHGDTVRAEVLPEKREKRRQARVLEVVKRARKRFVGTISKENGALIVKPDDHRIYTGFRIEKPPRADVSEHDKVVVRWKGWKDPKKLPRVEVVEALGRAGEHEVEMRSILADKGIDRTFPPEVLEEAQVIKEASKEDFRREIAVGKRRDFREVTTFTIDPETAKDFDDAISIRKIEKRIHKDKNRSSHQPPATSPQWEVGIHIADVSHYVKPKAAIDKEARKRGFSTYLVDRTIPMLPEVLSNDLCSLNPNEDRLAFSAVFEVDEQGGIHDRWFGKTLIYSDRRFTYREAQSHIEGGGEHGGELKVLNALAKKLRRRRFKNGAIDFADEEVEFVLKEDGEVQKIYKKERLDAHKLVEEFMLLANREVAKKIDDLSESSGKEHFFLYRVHDMPDRERLEELGVFLRALGYEFYVEEDIDPKDINAILAAVRGRAEEGIVNTSVLRSMAKAAYSTKSKGHFGLAFEYYTHFTSPIRRYPDLLVHRLLERHLEDAPIVNQEFAFYQRAASDLSEIEIRVMEAERESIAYKQVEYLSDRVGEEFDAVITGVSQYGFYIDEKETLASGMVNVRTLEDDYYELDRKNYALVGKDSEKTYRIGDTVRVKLVNADMDKRQLDFKLA